MSTEPHQPAGQPVEDLGFELPAPTTSSRWKVLVVFAVVVIGAFGFGYLRHKKSKDDVPVASGDKVTRVEVIKPSTSSTISSITLPGTVKALEETKIYPHVTGYIK